MGLQQRRPRLCNTGSAPGAYGRALTTVQDRVLLQEGHACGDAAGKAVEQLLRRVAAAVHPNLSQEGAQVAFAAELEHHHRKGRRLCLDEADELDDVGVASVENNLAEDLQLLLKILQRVLSGLLHCDPRLQFRHLDGSSVNDPKVAFANLLAEFHVGFFQLERRGLVAQHEQTGDQYVFKKNLMRPQLQDHFHCSPCPVHVDF